MMNGWSTKKNQEGNFLKFLKELEMKMIENVLKGKRK
jgi:hypothetical protein